MIAKTIFDGVIINRMIAVIISVRTPRLVAVIHAIPVVVPGREPKSGHAQFFQIRKMIDDSAKIAAMISARIFAIGGGGGSTGGNVVRSDRRRQNDPA